MEPPFSIHCFLFYPFQEFIASKKSALFFEVLSLSNKNSIASTVPI